jgi:hypothetical protein
MNTMSMFVHPWRRDLHMASVPVRHKHLRLNQAKLERVKSVLGTATETEALEGAMDLVLAEAEILKALHREKGKGRPKNHFA